MNNLTSLAIIVLMLPVLAQASLVQPGQSIQAAIDSADPGGIVEVQSGLYRENLVINKTITLRGLDIGRGTPAIDAGGLGSAIILNADGIVVEGLDLRNSSRTQGSGIMVLSKDNTIRGNNASLNSAGIEIRYSSGNIVENNRVTDNGFGVYLASSNLNTIRGNTISGNDFGLYLKSSNKNEVQGNHISNSYYRDVSDDGTNFYDSFNNVYVNPDGSCLDQDGDGLCDYGYQAQGIAISQKDALTEAEIILPDAGASYPDLRQVQAVKTVQPTDIHRDWQPSETGPEAGQSGVYIIDHSFAREILPSGEASGRTSTFSPLDAYAFYWVRFGPVYEEHSISWRWYSPDGSLYTTSEGRIPDPHTQGLDHWFSPKYWSRLTIMGDPAEEMPGVWRAEFYLDGRLMLSEQFSIG